jgi:hypothetical protein
MDTIAFSGDPASLSRLELVSLYINRYYKLDADLRSKFETEFRKRNLPLPRMPIGSPLKRDRTAGKWTMDRHTFLSYVLLIYSGTAFVYSWIYLAQRLVKMDFGQNPRHKLLQSAIALVYVIVEIFLYIYFAQLGK